MKSFPKIQAFGDQAVLLEWKSKIDPQIHKQVIATDTLVKKYCRKEIIETVFTYHSLAIYLKHGVDKDLFKKSLKSVLLKQGDEELKTNHIITIPVCYEEPYAEDINEVAKLHQLSIAEVINLHTKPLYKVYFLGFLPGFPYLGGLDKKLITPRKTTPKEFIEKGSVGIGGNQTGIYTVASPGGWNIIGATPAQLFSIDSLSVLKPDDFVKFKAITQEEFTHTEKEVEEGKYILTREVQHD